MIPIPSQSNVFNDAHEAKRLDALSRYRIVNTLEEDDFNDIAQMAQAYFGVPITLISFVEQDRQWFKAKLGTELTETPRAIAFCNETLKGDSLIVNDAANDSRFMTNPLVTGDPHIRFYAGSTLRSDEGFALGTVCVLDTKPREMSEKDSEFLHALSRQVMRLLEMKRTLIAKDNSEERLNFALDASAVIGTWDWDIARDLVFCDRRFASMFGIDPEAGAHGAPIEDFTRHIHPDDANRVDDAIRTACDTLGELNIEYRLLAPDGERTIVARGRAIADDSGVATRFPGAAVDITDRKRAERKQAARTELNDRLRDTRHTRDVSFVAAEIIGRVLDASRTGYGEMWDDARMVRVETDWAAPGEVSVAGEHEFSAYGKKFAEKIRAGEVVVIEDVAQSPLMDDNAERMLALNIHALINVSLVIDGVPRALFFVHDSRPRVWRQGEIDLVVEMAHRTWAEMERRHAEDNAQIALKRAEDASIAKTEFLANMSHEIRTPMNAIIGLSNLMANENLTPRQAEFIRTLQLSADSLLSLINDLLDISKIEARTIELEQIPFDVSRMVQEVISMMNVKAQEKNLTFEMDADCTQDRYFIGDPTRLRQIIVNLCSNAIKFTDKGGITIRIRCHETDTPGVEDLAFSVQDTGIGIAAAKLDTIFEKFVQADSSITRRYGGTGLGLAITRTLVNLMGGRIEVASTEGVGSTFTATIAMPLAAEAQSRAAASVAPAHARPVQTGDNAARCNRVLLVEDYAPNVLVAGTFLEEFGYEWDAAKSGAEALDCAVHGDYVAILMDVQMFGMNGLEATRLIRQHEKKTNARRVPIIGMTAHALSGDRERCLGAGMDDYLSKPFDPDDLEAKLKVYADARNAAV